MKLRLLKNSVRLRLQQGEVASVGAGGSVEESTTLPGMALGYRLDVADVERIGASFDAATLAVVLPRRVAAEWAASEQVSIAGEIALPGGQALSVLVEKDFKCLSPGGRRGDDEDADAFPHPEEGSGRGC